MGYYTMCICIYIYIHVHVHVHRDHGGVCWGCVGKSGFQWKHVYGRVFPGVFGIANSLQNVAHSQKLWSLSGRSVGTVTTWLGGNGLCSSWCSRQPAWWHGCYRKEQFCVVAKPPKNTICGSPNHQVGSVGYPVGTVENHPQNPFWSLFARFFWWGYCTHLIFI